MVVRAFCANQLAVRLHEVLPRWISFRAAANCTGQQTRANLCGASRKFIFGCTSGNNTDFFLKHFTPETTSHLARAGFPFKHSNAFLPWHERQMLKQLCSQQTFCRVCFKRRILIL